jgi:hypothetical protein
VPTAQAKRFVVPVLISLAILILLGVWLAEGQALSRWRKAFALGLAAVLVLSVGLAIWTPWRDGTHNTTSATPLTLNSPKSSETAGHSPTPSVTPAGSLGPIDGQLDSRCVEPAQDRSPVILRDLIKDIPKATIRRGREPIVVGSPIPDKTAGNFVEPQAGGTILVDLTPSESTGRIEIKFNKKAAHSVVDAYRDSCLLIIATLIGGTMATIKAWCRPPSSGSADQNFYRARPPVRFGYPLDKCHDGAITLDIVSGSSMQILVHEIRIVQSSRD